MWLCGEGKLEIYTQLLIPLRAQGGGDRPALLPWVGSGPLSRCCVAAAGPCHNVSFCHPPVTDGGGDLSSPMALSSTCEHPAWRVDVSEQPGASSHLAVCEGWPAAWGADTWSIVEDVQDDSVPSLYLLTSLSRKKLCETSKKSSRLQGKSQHPAGHPPPLGPSSA